MKLFKKKRDTSGSRRHARLWAQRLKTVGKVGAPVAAVIALVGWAWASGTLGRAGDWAGEKTIDATVAAGFHINDILVVGRNRIAPEELLSRLGMTAGDPMFGVSIATGQAAIADIPWIKTVTVSRRLPDTIVVNVAEREPAALWQYRQKLSLIDASGHVLSETGLEAYRHLPLVVGEHAPQDVAPFLTLLRAEPDIAKQLTAAVRIGNRRWDLKLKNGVLVKLPENNVELALRQLAVNHQQHNLLARDLKQIDLRIPEKLVVEPAATEDEKTRI